VKALSVLCLSLVIILFVAAQGITPREGFVPNQETAVRIAEVVLIPIYGKDRLESERPFTAKLKENTWTVYGTLRCSDGKGGSTTVGCRGGVAIVEISKLDARVLSVSHGR